MRRYVINLALFTVGLETLPRAAVTSSTRTRYVPCWWLFRFRIIF